MVDISSTSSDDGDKLIIANSITHVGSGGRDKIIVSGSHGGTSAALFAASIGACAAVFNDAGVGMNGAGIAGLETLERLGIAAVTVAHTTARIGEGQDTYENGVISHVNAAAKGLGVIPGQTCRAAVKLLMNSQTAQRNAVPPAPNTRTLIRDYPVKVWLVDSASEINSDDDGAIVITGSHGGAPGGSAAQSAKANVLAAVFNDAGVGRDRAGVSRLSALDSRKIAAVTVSHNTAMIGCARSTYESGIISFVNVSAANKGAIVGETVRDLVGGMIETSHIRSA